MTFEEKMIQAVEDARLIMHFGASVKNDGCHDRDRWEWNEQKACEAFESSYDTNVRKAIHEEINPSDYFDHTVYGGLYL